MVYIRYFWQGNHQIHSDTRCIGFWPTLVRYGAYIRFWPTLHTYHT